MTKIADIEDMYLTMKCNDNSMNKIIQSCEENHDNKPFTTFNEDCHLHIKFLLILGGVLIISQIVNILREYCLKKGMN